MKISSVVLASVAGFSGVRAAIPTWPSSIDELEDVMFLNTGYRSRGFSSHITPCGFSEFGAGRQTAAEWLRIGFHDMATTNVFFAPHGGIDGSIAFELGDGENTGAGFNTSLVTYSGFFNSRLPISDMIALGVYASVRGCGGPVIPMKGGRIDATAAGPAGVPQPQNGRGVFSNQFARMGFNVTDMIQMTACGHTLGGVHAEDFSNIVTPGTAPNDFQLFDTTTAFDNNIAVQYINGPNTDPLAVGPSVASGRNSDVAVFGADNNVTLRAMTNAATFNNMCTSILQRMIETVDPAITLSDVIQPYEVKPTGIQLTLLGGGTLLQFSGDIRVRTTARSVSSVAIIYKDRTGAGSNTITTSSSGTANGFDDSFSFYGFSSNLPVTSSISSFAVTVTYTTGATTTYDNNGNGFPIQDSVIVQTPQSCQSGGNLTVVAAVRSTATAPSLTVEQKVARPSGTPVPSLTNATVAMVAGASFGPYTLYSASYSIASSAGTKYGVSSGSFADTFKDASDLGATCAPLGTSVPTSTSSSTSVVSPTSSSTASSSKTSTSSSATSTPTLGVKPTVGAYTFQGCYTEGTNVRALSGASFYNYTSMTLEMCSTSCAGFTYWGVEYGGECYCGNTLDTTSTLAAAADCSFACPGNSYEYCGAGNRLELYKLTSQVSSSSSVISSSSSQVGTSSVVVTSSSSSVSSSRTSSATAIPTLHIVKSAGLYNYMGCFTEGNGVRALGAASHPSDTNTIEACVAACSPYLYAGAEYGRECWCADTFGSGSVIAPDSDCSMTCAGDQYEYCGAGNRLSVYIRNGTASQGTVSSSSSGSVSPSSTPPKTSTSSVITSTSPRSSPHSSTSTPKSVSSTRLSTSKLSSSTSSQSSSSKASSSSSSSIPISSSSTGATKSSTVSSISSQPSSSKSSTLSISSTKSLLTSSSKIVTSTSSATPSQTAPAIKTKIGNYTYLGCQTEGDGIRALTGGAFYNYTAMSLEMCATDCAGFKYWGVEYGGECYCGNSFNTGSVVAQASDCSFTCPGAPLEYCGAGNRLSAYVLNA